MGIGNGSKAAPLVTLLQMADEFGLHGSIDERRAIAMRLVADAGLEGEVVASWAGTPALPEPAARQVAVFAAERRRQAQEHAERERRRQARQIEAEAAARAAAWPTGAEVDTKEGAEAWQAMQERYKLARSEAAWSGD